MATVTYVDVVLHEISPALFIKIVRQRQLLGKFKDGFRVKLIAVFTRHGSVPHLGLIRRRVTLQLSAHRHRNNIVEMYLADHLRTPALERARDSMVKVYLHFGEAEEILHVLFEHQE